MKALFALLVFSTLSHACPPLEGSYQCFGPNQSNKYQLIIENDLNNNLKLISDNSKLNIKIDGNKHSFLSPLDKKFGDFLYKATCRDNQLEINVYFYLSGISKLILGQKYFLENDKLTILIKELTDHYENNCIKI